MSQQLPSPQISWRPPSGHLHLREGIWQVEAVSPISYPEAGHDACFQVEDQSYWFRHRLDCLFTVLKSFPPGGTLFDIGGGNGYVARALQAAGLHTALLEPGPGVYNARKRGVSHLIQATLEDARFHPHSLPAAGAFDVLEHIADDAGFLLDLRGQLAPGGRFYCTVPAIPALWSADDEHAGHFRRYTSRSLVTTLAAAGFTVEFVSPIFLWLTVPVFLGRTVASWLHLTNQAKAGTPTSIHSAHRLPRWLAGSITRIHAWEIARLRDRRRLPFGTSLLCVARADGA